MKTFRNVGFLALFGTVVAVGPAELQALFDGTSAGRYCMAGLNWMVSDGLTMEGCAEQAYDIAYGSGGIGNDCYATCDSACETAPLNDIWMQLGCTEQPDGYFKTGQVKCYCENQPGGGLD